MTFLAVQTVCKFCIKADEREQSRKQVNNLMYQRQTNETTCFTQYLSYLNPKGEDSSCNIYGFMGMAGLMVESHPPNFENYIAFKDVQMMLK